MADEFRGKGGAGGLDVLVVLPKPVIGPLRKLGPIPRNVVTMTFGKLRGQDRAKDVAAALIVSRPMPRVKAVEDQAEVISGKPVKRLPPGQFYEHQNNLPVFLADGAVEIEPRVYRHPDPLVEALRWQACEAEVIQAVGRVRAVRRTAANPVVVRILTSTPLGDDVRPNRTLTRDQAWKEWTRTDAVSLMEAAGVVPEDWQGRGKLLAHAGMIPRASNLAAAARGHFARKRVLPGRLAALLTRVKAPPAVVDDANRAVLPNIYSNRRNCAVGTNAPETPPQERDRTPSAGADRFRYRLAGQRKGGFVWITPQHAADPRAAAEAAGLGPLDLWAPAGATTGRRRKPTQPRPAPGAPAATTIPLAPSVPEHPEPPAADISTTAAPDPVTLEPKEAPMPKPVTHTTPQPAEAAPAAPVVAAQATARPGSAPAAPRPATVAAPAYRLPTGMLALPSGSGQAPLPSHPMPQGPQREPWRAISDTFAPSPQSRAA